MSGPIGAVPGGTAPGAGVMTIGAEMRVGSLAESVTVTGESPVVDIQTARQQMVIDGDVVRALPASRSYGNYIAALPAILSHFRHRGYQFVTVAELLGHHFTY